MLLVFFGSRLRNLALAATVMASLVAAPASAQSYVGKLCLQSTVTERETGTVAAQIFTSQYDVTHMGGSSYSLAGFVNIADQPFISAGSATVIGSDIYINVTTTQNHPDGWRDTGVNQTRLNLTTLSGTFYEIGHDYNPTTKTWDDTRFTAGTITQTACP